MIDPNEAPDGFVAKVASSGCNGCAFRSLRPCDIIKKCTSIYRKDKESVIFIPLEKSNLAEFSAIGELAEASARIKELEGINHGLTFQNDGLKRKIAAQRDRIRHLEGATNNATGTPLSKAKEEVSRLQAAIGKLQVEFNKLKKDRYLARLALNQKRDEAARWKSSHDHVCRKFADCENARDENARLCEEARDEASRWKAQCLDRDNLIAKLKAQLTTALESIARMR